MTLVKFMFGVSQDQTGFDHIILAVNTCIVAFSQHFYSTANVFSARMS